MAYNFDVDKKKRRNDEPVEVAPVDIKALQSRSMVETIRNNFEAIIQVRVCGNKEATNSAHRVNYRKLEIKHVDGCNKKYTYMILDRSGEVLFRNELSMFDFCKTLIKDWNWVNVTPDVFTYIKKCGLHNILANGICNFYYDNWKNWSISPQALMTDYGMLNSLMTDAYQTRNTMPKSSIYTTPNDAIGAVVEAARVAV
jgi:hypothetical protein